jgi:hypothetical protein
MTAVYQSVTYLFNPLFLHERHQVVCRAEGVGTRV